MSEDIVSKMHKMVLRHIDENIAYRYQAAVLSAFSELAYALQALDENSPDPDATVHAGTGILVGLDLQAEIKSQLDNGGKVAMIKSIRSQFGIGLKEAKDMVEEIHNW